MPQPKQLPSLSVLMDRLLYDHNSGVLTWKKHEQSKRANSRVAGTKVYGKNALGQKKPSYIKVIIDRHEYPAHRIAMVMSGYSLQTDLSVDHINRNPFDNRICNLRIATHSQNMKNIKKKSLQKYTGVRKYGSGSFMARIRDGENGVVQINGFSNDVEAAMARDIMAIRLHKEFAVLNFPRHLYFLVAR